MKTLRIEPQGHGIVSVILDRPNEAYNLIDVTFAEDLARCLDELEAMPDLQGVLLRSAKKTFLAGGDLKLLSQVNDANGQDVLDLLTSFKHSQRRLEHLHKPVVACLTGTALGGGFELALACSRRFALADESLRFGLPEVSLGLLPAAGGVSRLVRMLGLEAALPLLTEGKVLTPKAADAQGLLDGCFASEDELLGAATAWIAEHPEVLAPWDQKGFKLPGGLPNSPRLAPMLSVAPAMIRQKTHGCLPAPVAVLAAAAEGASVDIEASFRIENRYFLPLAKGGVAKNLINSLFFQKNALQSGVNRPEGEAEPIHKVGIVGAGMMGAGIAWACASKGVEVVLLDVSQERAEQGKAYSTRLVEQRMAKGRLSEAEGEEILGRIHTTDDYQALADCDLVVEAVFENRALKAEVSQKVMAVLKPGALLASNTSTLPISSLAEAVPEPSRFFGLHFFSPVEKMPLVEIIRGKDSDEAGLARAYDLVQRLGKTPIVVNDGRGFFTSRVFGTYTYEGLAMLAEGIAPAKIENAAWLAGFPVGPLAVMDEVSLTLLQQVRDQTRADQQAEGQEVVERPGDRVLDRMLALQRTGRSAGAGFYDYPEGAKKRLWPGLLEALEQAPVEAPLADLKDRLLYVQALETVRILDEGVLNSVAEADIGSIFGLGYPAWTGGVLQFINQSGLSAFAARAQILAERYGSRFEPPASLIKRAASGEPFKDKNIMESNS
ncbi:MAG: enoyl-CoA hydratase/isomerase family protein [Saccharospirillum sp.]|nr:enoyl-CoA hydratase/isomerase family protein [Saccharospirillum sp.]